MTSFPFHSEGTERQPPLLVVLVQKSKRFLAACHAGGTTDKESRRWALVAASPLARIFSPTRSRPMFVDSGTHRRPLRGNSEPLPQGECPAPMSSGVPSQGTPNLPFAIQAACPKESRRPLMSSGVPSDGTNRQGIPFEIRSLWEGKSADSP